MSSSTLISGTGPDYGRSAGAGLPVGVVPVDVRIPRKTRTSGVALGLRGTRSEVTRPTIITVTAADRPALIECSPTRAHRDRAPSPTRVPDSEERRLRAIGSRPT